MMKFAIGDRVRIVRGEIHPSRAAVVVNAYKDSRGLQGCNEYQIFLPGFGHRVFAEHQLRLIEDNTEPRSLALAA